MKLNLGSGLGSSIILKPRNSGGLQNSLLNNLAAWWSLDESTGTRYDSHNNLSMVPTGTLAVTGGKINNCLDTSGGGMVYDPGGDERIDFSSTGVCVSVWLYANAWTGYPICRHHDSVSTSDVAAFFLAATSGTVKFYARGTSLSSVQGPALSTGEWVHVAFGCDLSAQEIWLVCNNGTVYTTPHTTGLYPAMNIATQIGRRALNFQFNGLIDEAAFWQRGRLTADEITELYNNGNGIGYSNL